MAELEQPASTSAKNQVKQAQLVAQGGELRDLAMKLGQRPALPDDATTLVKGVVTAVDFNGTPPTVSLHLGGDTTKTVSGIRFWDSVSPYVGQTVILAKQGSDIIVVAHVAEAASTWTKPSLNGGWSHNGNSQGDLQYRKVFDNGSWKMQWQGAVGTGTGDILTLPGGPTGFRPSSKRKMLGARDHANGLTACILVFETDGRVHLEGENYTISSGSHTHAMGTSGAAGNSHKHSHNGAVNETSFVETHQHAMGTSASASANVTVSYPNWVSFNNVEYFL